ncbi:MAG: aryl-sulfate sulfotransferase [Acidimicrobiales bacterium]
MLTVVTAALLFAGACSDSTGSKTARNELVTRVVVRAAPHSAHIPVVTVTTSRSATVTVTATSGRHRVVTPASTTGTTLRVPVLGLRTDRDYTLSVTAETASGVVDRYATDAHYRTPPLPTGFPKFAVTSDPKRVSAGITLIPLISGESGALKDPVPGQKKSPLATGRLVGVDETGEVVWYYESELEVISVEPTSHDTLLLGIDEGSVLNLDGSVREIDMLGNTVAAWSSRLAQRSGKTISAAADGEVPVVQVAMDSFHHDVRELPNGNLIALSTELITVDPDKGRKVCPQSPVERVVGDVVVEFKRTGEVVGQWPLSAVYDPMTRPGTDLCTPNAATPDGWMYPGVTDERDWTHANAVTVDEAHNTLIVSLRQLDAVIGLRYRADGSGPAGRLLWELGPHGDLAMQGDGGVQYHQHSTRLLPDGSLVLFDNGNDRPAGGGDGADQPYSRAVIYRIDAATRSVTQVWSHRDDNPWGGPSFVPFLGGADPLEGGNVLITYGVIADSDRRPHTRIVEVAPDLAGGGAGDKVVLDILVGGDTGSGWVSYHAVKIPSLYPRR